MSLKLQNNKDIDMIDKNLIVELETPNGYMSYYKNDIAFVHSLQHNNKIFETDLVMQHLADTIRKATVVIDGGAHAGSHTILYKYINPDVIVHSFEPQSKMFELLFHNIEQNNLTNVFLHNFALANKDLTTKMSASVIDIVHDENHEPIRTEGGQLQEVVYTNISYGDDNLFNLGGLGFGEDGEEVKSVTIDSLNLEQCDFIKLDLEGSESLALFGALETIKKLHPTILFEHNHHQLSDKSYEEFGALKKTPFEILFSLGYSITPIEQDNYLAKALENRSI